MGWIYALDREATVAAADQLQLTTTERKVLALVGAWDDEPRGPLTVYEFQGAHGHVLVEAYQSLSRMAYIVQEEPRRVVRASVVDCLSEAGQARLDSIRARVYKCCPDAISMPCVCMESTYCPHGHPNNGCHGTHD